VKVHLSVGVMRILDFELAHDFSVFQIWCDAIFQVKHLYVKSYTPDPRTP